MSQKGLLRASHRYAFHLRSPVLRATLQRRLASSDSTALKGVEDNAFNRERQSIKDHAAGTSGESMEEAIHLVRFDSGFVSKVDLPDPILSFCSVAIPCLIIASLNAYNLWNEHWEHWDHMPPLEERTQYPYQNIRNKAFPWGDGDKTLFWNPKVNYKPPPDA
ncbi:MAG: Cytochrome c oxidase subunit 6A, mitochondrial [Piccolia ochrophora]|nr:MAG: Cytochrome c oxidase subunit 6A, mitochondrial [Piccolia ochrophora]